MNLVKLNLARNCLKYIIRAYKIKELWVPFYTCEVIWKTIKQEGCKIKFYHVNKDFTQNCEFGVEDYILYTNYFGVCSKICKSLARKYKNLIVDNTHALYSESIGLASFNSLRKFLPVEYGAYLYIDKELEENLLEENFEINYYNPNYEWENYLKSELLLDELSEVKLISKSVERKVSKIDFETESQLRKENFSRLETLFLKHNELNISIEENEVPYCYPLLTDNEVIKQSLSSLGITFVKHWKDFPQEISESYFNDLIALPLDTNFVELVEKLRYIS